MEIDRAKMYPAAGLHGSLGKIGVLMGGPSSEREISFKSGHAVLDALLGLGIDALEIDIATDQPQDTIRLVRSSGIDCAFLALHGRFGEDGTIQAILDSIQLPYTGSGARASRLAMDKEASRSLFREAGLAVPGCVVLRRGIATDGLEGSLPFSLPVVVKPVTHGSSIGLSIVDDTGGLRPALAEAFSFDERILIEKYIRGRELTVGILDDRPLPVVEIVPKKRFFDYEAKYSSGMTEYVVPAELDSRVAEMVQQAGLRAHRVLGCSGCSRVDVILGDDGTAYVLELNSIPGMTPLSLLPKAAKAIGIDFGEVCMTLIRRAYERAQESSIR